MAKRQVKKPVKKAAQTPPDPPEEGVAVRPPEGAAVLEYEYLHVDQLEPSEWNTNYMTHEQFQFLVDELKAKPFIEPLKVVPTDRDVRIEDATVPVFRIIRGEHRHRACKVVGYRYVPCCIGDEDDEKDQKLDVVRGNMIRGQQDQSRFSSLVDELKGTYGMNEAELRSRMALTQGAFQKLYRNESARKEKRQKDAKADMKGTEKRMKAVDGISVLIHKIFTEHGDDLEFGFIGFEYGGQVNFLVPLTSGLNELIGGVADGCRAGGLQMQEALDGLLRGSLSLDEIEALTADGEGENEAGNEEG